MTDSNGKENPNQEYSSPIQFPCDFIIKVMGKNEGDFKGLITNIIKKHYPDITEDNITTRPSKDNNYLAVTIKVYANSKEELDKLYHELSDTPEILMAL